MSTKEQTSCITTYRKVSLEKNKLFLDSVSRADTIYLSKKHFKSKLPKTMGCQNVEIVYVDITINH